MGRKHCGKRRNCSLRAISPFPTVFSKDLYCRHVKKTGLVWEGVNSLFSNFQQRFKKIFFYRWFMKSLDPVMKGSSNIIRYFIVTRNIFFLIRAGLK